MAYRIVITIADASSKEDACEKAAKFLNEGGEPEVTEIKPSRAWRVRMPNGKFLGEESDYAAFQPINYFSHREASKKARNFGGKVEYLGMITQREGESL